MRRYNAVRKVMICFGGNQPRYYTQITNATDALSSHVFIVRPPRSDLHLDRLQRILVACPRVPRHAVIPSTPHYSPAVIPAVQVGLVAPEIPPRTREAARATSAELARRRRVVVDVTRRELPVVVLEQRVWARAAVA